jgi:hypothetical protein
VGKNCPEEKCGGSSDPERTERGMAYGVGGAGRPLVMCVHIPDKSTPASNFHPILAFHSLPVRSPPLDFLYTVLAASIVLR